MTHQHDVDGVHEVHERATVTHRRSPLGMIERVVVFIFGLIQLLLVLRIVLVLLTAREGNNIVSLVYDVSDVLVAPFRGILRLEQVSSGQAALDVAAIVALVGWTIIELIVLALVRIGRPSTA